MRGRPVVAMAGLSALFCAVLSLFGGTDGDAPRPPADPALREEIKSLVGDLGHSDHGVRATAAARLAEIGPDAVWALVPAAESEDTEIRLRAGELLERMAWVSPGKRREIDRLVGLLKTTRDPRVAAHTFRTLEGMGSGARGILKDLFSGGKADPGEFELTVLPEKTTIACGTPAKARVCLRNTGKRPLWIRPSAFFPCRDSGEADNAFHLFFQNLQQAGAFDLLCVAPGESFEQDVTLESSQTLEAGPFRLSVLYDTTAGRGGPRPGSAAFDARIRAQGEDPDREIIHRATRLRARAEAGPLYALPSLDQAPGSPAVDIVLAARETASGSPLSFDLILTGEEPDDGTPGFRCWAALLDEKGEVAAMRTFETGPPAALQAPGRGETTGVKGVLPQDVPPGRYRLVAGFTDGDPAEGRTWRSVSMPVPVTIK